MVCRESAEIDEPFTMIQLRKILAGENIERNASLAVQRRPYDTEYSVLIRIEEERILAVAARRFTLWSSRQQRSTPSSAPSLIERIAVPYRGIIVYRFGRYDRHQIYGIRESKTLFHTMEDLYEQRMSLQKKIECYQTKIKKR